jgi:antitoxin ParD1/3/4
MNVSLTPELEQFIQRQVNTGKYNSPEEVIIRGIQLLASIERFSKGSVEILQPTKPKTE